MNQNTRGVFRKAVLVSVVCIAMPSLRGGGRIPPILTLSGGSVIQYVGFQKGQDMALGLACSWLKLMAHPLGRPWGSRKSMLMIACPIHPGLAQRFDVDCTMSKVDAKVK
jgi:hypothetical protein